MKRKTAIQQKRPSTFHGPVVRAYANCSLPRTVPVDNDAHVASNVTEDHNETGTPHEGPSDPRSVDADVSEVCELANISRDILTTIVGR